MTETTTKQQMPDDPDFRGLFTDRTGLRIAVLSDALQHRNGVDAYYRDLVNHLAPHVERISLLTPNAADGDLAADMIRMPLPGDATQNVFFPQPSKINSRIRELAPNVLVSATNGPFGMYGVYLSHRHDIKLIAGFHTHIEELCDMYWGRMLGWITRTYMESQNKILFRRAANVVVNSHSMVEPARSLSETDVSLMGTPLDSQFLERPIIPPRKQLQRVFFGGRLAPEKNIDALIEAARRLPHIDFTIAGDGPQREEIEAHAETLANLNYVGLLPRDSMVDQIDSHDLVVLPSHLEAFGTIALEAMVRERLVLVSSQCGILSWQNLARGLYSYQKDEPLADALLRIAAIDNRLRHSKARQAREEALAIHSQAVQGWLDLLSSRHDASH
ncbi:MAG: glycosyltransferase family 4 protein [Gammaproteobacteria bacterium]|nr:glycosyltransferase family 4 protein [Gammaproteobacteria bacterium]